MNVKVFNLMSRVNETGFLVQHKPSECKCRLNASVYAKQKWVLVKMIASATRDVKLTNVWILKIFHV